MDSIYIFAYIRMSKDTSDAENQRFEIDNYCIQNFGKKPNEYYEETITGKKTASERELGVLLKKLKKDNVFVAASTSRIGRNFFDMMETAKLVLEANARFIAIQQKFELTNDFQGKMLMTLYSLMAEGEREDISLRTKAALQRKKAAGIKLGRPNGTYSPVLLENKNQIAEYLKKGLSFTAIGKIYDVTRQTVSTFIKKQKLAA